MFAASLVSSLRTRVGGRGTERCLVALCRGLLGSWCILGIGRKHVVLVGA